ncbi:MAG: non-homologous end-joining DNA ligase, partial [Gemmatimonadota bacterium]
MTGERTIEVDGRRVTLCRPDKLLFPDAGITKGDLADYYLRVARVLLPHARDRAISMERYPEGIEDEGFYHKAIPDHFPAWIDRATLPKQGGEITHVVIRSAATLVYLVDQACITPHTWPSRVDRPHRPDRLIFDLDPPEDGSGGFELVRRGARALHDVLRDLGLVPFVMTTGSRGLHVVVPLERRHSFGEVRRFARELAELLTAREPDRYTTEQRKAARGARLFLDTLRNGYAQTVVPPYAARARPGAPVATPLEWEELGRADLVADRFTISNLFRRLGQRDGDPWHDLPRRARPLGSARRRL